MSKELFISSSPHETKVAVLEDDELVEVRYERDTDVGLVGGIYKGRVSRVLPGMQSAFVDIGLERDAFLYVTDFFFEDSEDYDKVFDEAETRLTHIMTEVPPAAAPAAAPAAGVSPSVVPGAESTPAALAASPGLLEAASTAAAPTSALSPPPAGSTTPSGAPSPPPPTGRAGESSESRRQDHRGRRRRGRGFGERKFPPRSEFRDRPRERQDYGASHSFEILPGESLAKYSHATRSAPPPATPTNEATSEPTAPASILSRAPQGVPEGPIATGSEIISTNSSPAEAPPVTGFEVPEGRAPVETVPGRVQPDFAATRVAPSPSDERIGPIAHAPEPPPLPEMPPLAIFETARMAESLAPPPSADQPEPAAFEAAPQGEEPLAAGPDESPPESAGDLVEDEAFAPEASAAPLPTVQPEAGSEGIPSLPTAVPSILQEGGGAEAQSPAQTAPPAPSAGPAEQRSYTLREPQQRPRFAPRRGRRGRGGMGHRAPRPEGRYKPAQPAATQPLQISEMLKEGQEILVQIAKEPLGNKGARITSHIALPGRYLVCMPTINHIGVSRKIPSEQERLRLRNMILDNKGSLTGGFIVRTAGAGRSEEEFKADLKFLSTLWNDIRAKAERVKAPALIHRDLDLVQRILRDILSPDFKSIRVDSEVEYERVVDFVSRSQPSLVGKVKLYTRDTPLFEEFGVHAEIEKALKPKVWLKSGGYIVINQTEALVAIDVNTGKYVGKTNRLEDTILKTNIDAVNEIVRQIRLRDLGGIIVIDFIDMDERRNRNKVGQVLEEALRRDRAPTKILAFNDFGLVAITRKRVKQSLERTLSEPCSYCTGSGWIKSVTTVCYEILAEARKMAKQIEGNAITLRVNPEVAHALKSREGVLISELESITHKDIIVKSDPAVHQERFEIF